MQWATGQLQEAMDTWQQAIALYDRVSVAEGLAGKIRSQINRAGAMQASGLYRQALKTLTRVAVAVGTSAESAE